MATTVDEINNPRLTVAERLQNLEFFNVRLQVPAREKKLPKLCLDIQTRTLANHMIYLQKRFGANSKDTESANAEAWLSWVGTQEEIRNETGLPVAVKFMPFKDKGALLHGIRGDIYSNKALAFETWVEVAGLDIVRLFVEQGICPFFPLLYRKGICTHCFYETPKLAKEGPKQCLVLISELATGNYREWLRAAKRSIHEIRALQLQILFALFVLQDFTGSVHRDTHHGNVLVAGPKGPGPKRPNGYRYGRMWRSIYKVPNFDTVAWLWDFQFLFRAGKLDSAHWYDDERDQGKEGLARGDPFLTADFRNFVDVGLHQEASAPHRLDAQTVEWLRTLEDLTTKGIPLHQIIEVGYSDWKVPGGIIPTDSVDFIEEFDVSRAAVVPPELCALKVFLPKMATPSTCTAPPNPRTSLYKFGTEEFLTSEFKNAASNDTYLPVVRGASRSSPSSVRSSRSRSRSNTRRSKTRGRSGSTGSRRAKSGTRTMATRRSTSKKRRTASSKRRSRAASQSTTGKGSRKKKKTTRKGGAGKSRNIQVSRRKKRSPGSVSTKGRSRSGSALFSPRIPSSELILL